MITIGKTDKRCEVVCKIGKSFHVLAYHRVGSVVDSLLLLRGKMPRRPHIMKLGHDFLALLFIGFSKKSFQFLWKLHRVRSKAPDGLRKCGAGEQKKTKN